ncbi:hypothetical protein MKEN_00312200 [Mycena kentingensis (nom. inval.)]|nr:hypothetical protein MKEN_00312200 [Mycena kentingensis (nom. inval.)]
MGSSDLGRHLRITVNPSTLAVSVSAQDLEKGIIIASANAAVDSQLPRAQAECDDPAGIFARYNIDDIPQNILGRAELVQLGLRLLKQGRLSLHVLHTWFIAHGAAKLRARIRGVFRLWTAPNGLLKTLLDVRLDPSLPAPSGRAPVLDKVRSPIQSTIPELIADDGTVQTVVNAQTAPLWVKLVAIALRELSLQMGVGTDGYTDASTSPDPHVAHLWLLILHYLTMSPANKELFRRSDICKKILPRFSFYPSVPDDANNCEEELDLIRSDHTSGGMLIYHLRTLSCWWAALHHFTRDENSSFIDAPLRLHSMSTQAPLHDELDSDTISSIALKLKRDTIAQLGVSEEEFNLLDVQLRDPEDKSSVHAEASLILHLQERSNGNPEQHWLLGTPNRCCPSCWWLSMLLSSDLTLPRMHSHRLTPRPAAWMRSTHYSVFGWAPPPGISVETLRTLRDYIFAAYINVCKAGLVDEGITSLSWTLFL